MTQPLVKLHFATLLCLSFLLCALPSSHASELSFKSSILTSPTPLKPVASLKPVVGKMRKLQSPAQDLTDKLKTKAPKIKVITSKAITAKAIKPAIKTNVTVNKNLKTRAKKTVIKAQIKIKIKKAAQKKIPKPHLKIKMIKTPNNKYLRTIKRRTQKIHPALLKRLLARKGLQKGNPIFIRIFKKEGELELWMRSGRRFSLLKIYNICKYSGHLGPKLAENDRQSPEGFYTVSRRQLKPDSAYYRAFNIGYPNKYDRAWGRTGSLIMVHGACQSIGCFAMTNKVMGEIYTIVDAALGKHQQEFPVHIFPFRLTAANMDRYKKHRWSGFWWNLKRGHDMFEQSLLPPITSNKGRLYTFSWPKEPLPIRHSTKRKPVMSWNNRTRKIGRTRRMQQTH